MVANINIEPGFDIGKIKKTHKDLAKQLGDNRSLWRAFSPIIGKEVMKNIVAEGAMTNVVWPRLDRETLRRKKSKGKDRGMLRFKGRMEKRILSKSGYRKRVTRKMMVFGPKTFQDKAVMGGTIGNSMPERNPVGWTRGMATQLDQMMATRIAKLMKEYEW